MIVLKAKTILPWSIIQVIIWNISFVDAFMGSLFFMSISPIKCVRVRPNDAFASIAVSKSSRLDMTLQLSNSNRDEDFTTEETKAHHYNTKNLTRIGNQVTKQVGAWLGVHPSPEVLAIMTICTLWKVHLASLGWHRHSI